MTDQNKFTITKLIEHAERAYKEYGDIQVAIRTDEMHIAPICQVGIAGVDPENRNIDTTYLCFGCKSNLKEILAEEPPLT